MKYTTGSKLCNTVSLSLCIEMKLCNTVLWSILQEGNYVTLSETSDEMYAAIEDNVYMDPEGPAQG